MKKEWEVLIMGNTFESKDIFKQVEKLHLLFGDSKITKKEVRHKIRELENRDDEFGLEISVIRKDNRHGHDSYGWGNENKIILWDSGGSVGNSMDTYSILWCKKIAELQCDSMNKKGK